jgi:uncharacterized membrane protein
MGLLGFGSMTLYEALLFVHVFAAVLWIGSATLHVVLMQLARRSGEREQMLTLMRYDDRLGPTYYLPLALIALGAGIGLVLEGDWGFDRSWVIAGLALFAIALIVGLAFFIPAGKRLNEAVEAHGPKSDQAFAVVRQVEVVATLDLLLLYAAIFVMTVKP